MKFILATTAHEPGLRRLHAETPLHGPIRIAEHRDPDFFQALAVQGDLTEAISWCDEHGTVAGMGTRSSLPVWIDGKADRVGYLGALRSHPGVRKGIGLARGYQFLRQRHEAAPGCRFYLSTVMEDNPAVQQLLASGRVGLPHYLDAGQLCCHALSPRRLVRRGRANPNLEIVAADRDSLSPLLAFLAEEGARTDFFPILTAADFASPRLRHLVPEDFLIARAVGSRAILGTLAVWDQSPFRQFRIDGYSLPGKFYRCLANGFADLGLPAAGQPLRFRQAAFICIRDHDPAVFEALLRTAAARIPSGTLLSAGFPASHPLQPTLARLAAPAPAVRSRIYLVGWEEALPECRARLAAQRPFHLDPATL
jgi:hypothetical protein